MKADFTRFRFDPAQQRRRVYDQQGRVALDADQNESVDIAEYLRAAGIRDVVGPSGGPLDGAGFALTAAGADLTIGAGRFWVDGLLVENDAAGTSLLAQPHVPAGASVVVLPNGSAGPVPPANGVYVAFLETWERLLTAVEDDSLREPALGGPDTTVRTQQVWQVRLLQVGAVGTAVNCASNLPSWNSLVAAPTVTMAARSAVSTTPPDDCTVPADAGFRGTENQHYRVEIHQGGAVGTATFVWSRENGSVVTRWTARSGDELTVSSPGRDGALGFAPGDWVELIDESRELTRTPGTLVRLAGAGGDRLVIDPATATGTVDLNDFPANPRIRRWDSDGPLTVEVPATNDGWIPLELGVEVHWPAAGTFRTGDWWSVPARTALGDVIWPAPGGTPAELPPFGDRHHFARLAIAQLDGGVWTVLADCRELFPPLTGLESLFMLGGDGQEALPDVANPATLVALGEPLRVGVANGRTPVAGAPVQFSVTTGAGQVNGAATATVATDADGVASAAWSLDSTTASQVVTARLLDAGGSPVHLPVRFDASLSLAAEVAYVPGDCAPLAGARTVQQALDILCANGGDGCATLVLSPGENWQAPLLALPDDANARICFRPGEFVVTEPVTVVGKGTLVISGAGAASRVVAPGHEVALAFVNCEEVVIRDLAVVAGVAGGSPERPGLNGALRIEECSRVTVESVSLQCGAGTSRAASCLSVRGVGTSRPASVRIRDCDFVVGHLQVGALVLDTATVEVTGCTLRVAPKPASLSLDVLLADPHRRGALVRQLVGRPLASGAPTVRGPSFTTQIHAGGFTLAFNSPVPQHEWQALADANPPSPQQVANPQALQQWAANLAGQVLDAPAGLPAFRRQVAGVRRRVGDEAFGQVAGTAAGRALLASSLIAGDISVLDATATAGERDKVVQVAGGRVVFDSVLANQTWSQMLAAAGISQVGSGTELKQRLNDLARRALTDAAFRAQVPALGAWFASLVNQNPAVASQGVVVGGGVAESVIVRDNQLLGVAEAVHVGVSAGGQNAPGADRQAGKVELRGNRAVLRVPVELQQAPRAFFVGNARTAVIAGNEATVEGRTGPAVQQGVRVWGSLGPLLLVADNVLAGCATGVQVVPTTLGPTRRRWHVEGNVAPDAEIGVAAPVTVTRTANVPL